MDSRFSIPTDNIYKFYALFGLAICISAMVLFVLTYNSYFDSKAALLVELAKLELTEETNKLIETKEEMVDVIDSNKNFYIKVIGSALGVGIAVMIYGFHNWHYKVQPQVDKLTALQIRVLEKELADRNRLTLVSHERGKNKPSKVR